MNSPRKHSARRQSVARQRGVVAPCASRTPLLTEGESQNKSKVDWMTATWKPEPDEVLGLNIHSLLMNCMGDVVGVEAPGMMGYDFGIKFSMVRFGSLSLVGRLDYGGEKHKGRCRLDLNGTGCSQVKNWLALQVALGGFEDLKLTRVDLALDFLQGEYGVEDASRRVSR